MMVLIRGAQILAGSPAALSRADVLIDGDRVAAVGPALAAPADARVLDATGRILLPGSATLTRTPRVISRAGAPATGRSRIF